MGFNGLDGLFFQEETEVYGLAFLYEGKTLS